LVKGKNIGLLLHSVENLNLKIGIIGDGPEKHKLMKNANKNIRFLGFMKEDKEVYSYMKSSKILVLPSSREGFGIAVLEAMAAGCKVITMDSKYNAAMELVDPNFICNANDLRKKIVESFNKKYKNQINLYDYDIHKIAKKLEQFYKRCING